MFQAAGRIDLANEDDGRQLLGCRRIQKGLPDRLGPFVRPIDLDRQMIGYAVNPRSIWQDALLRHACAEAGAELAFRRSICA